MPELKTEPGWKPASRRPWWAAALVGGLGAGAAIAAALGLTAPAVKGAEPHVAVSGVVVPPSEEALWRTQVTAKLNELGERMARIEGRLERK